MSFDLASEVECPRCGYDLSGLTSSWSDACPLEGECNECALRIEWRDLLDPMRVVPGWSFEHGHNRLLRRFLGTWLRSAVPFRFWRQVRMEHPVVRGRLAVFAIAVAAVAHVVCGLAAAGLEYAVMTGVVWIGGTRWTGGWGPSWGSVNLFRLALELVWPYNNPLGSGPWVLMVMLWTALVPVGFLALRDTFRQCRVRPVHLVRATAYTLPLIGFFVMFWVVGRTVGEVVSDLNPGSTATALAGMALGWLVGATRYEWALLAIVGVVLGLHWLAVTRRYLRLPHAVGVTATMLAISGMAAFLVALFLNWDAMANRLTAW